MNKVPGVDMSTGSLGQGISAACGMALSGKLSNDFYKVYAILGDGEIEEGQVWEAAMFAAHYQLDNLVAVVDNNGLQIDGRISDVMSPYPIDEKFKAFGWHVISIDAHDFDAIEKAFAEAEKISGQPTVIIQRSIKGKGVSFMEDQVVMARYCSQRRTVQTGYGQNSRLILPSLKSNRKGNVLQMEKKGNP